MSDKNLVKTAKNTTTEEDSADTRLGKYKSNEPFLYIPSFSEPIRKTPGRPRSERSFLAHAPKPKAKDPRFEKFVVELPPPHHLKDENGENWTLWCVCKDTTDTGFLVQCEKCGTWQHGICFNINSHTTPEKYVCEVCGNRPIRCRCEENLNYRNALIKCSQCGYYVHKQCEGFLYGPMPNGTFVCSMCGNGKSKFTYPKIRIPPSITFENKTFTFSKENIEKTLNERVLSGPFNDFLMIDVFDSTLTKKEFFEDLFDRFRPFFFLCHPLFSTSVQKRRVQNLVTNVVNASEYLCRMLYNVDHALFVRVMDSLMNTLIYRPPEFVDDPEETGLSFSENGRNDFLMFPPQYIAQMPTSAPLKATEKGVVCAEDLTQGQFLTSVDGFLCDLEEFNYDNKVDSALYQLRDTRLVLDASRFRNSIIHKFKRSMYGNCVLKLFTVGEKVFCGIFVGRAQLVPYDHTQILTVKAGEPLTLGIDFLPAVCEDFTRWLPWHFGSIDATEFTSQRPTPEQRELQLAIRASAEKQAKEKKKKQKQFEDDDEKKKKLKAKEKKKRLEAAAAAAVHNPTEPYTLFELLEADDPGPLLFFVGDRIRYIEEEVKVRVAPQTQGHRGRPRIHPKVPGRPASAPNKHGRRPGRPPLRDSDDSSSDEVIKERKPKHTKPVREPKITKEIKQEIQEEEETEETKPVVNKVIKEAEGKAEIKKIEQTNKVKQEAPTEERETEDAPKEEEIIKEKVDEEPTKEEEKKEKVPVSIFSLECQKEIIKYSKKIEYIPTQISDPKKQIIDILGL